MVGGEVTHSISRYGFTSNKTKNSHYIIVKAWVINSLLYLMDIFFYIYLFFICLWLSFLQIFICITSTSTLNPKKRYWPSFCGTRQKRRVSYSKTVREKCTFMNIFRAAELCVFVSLVYAYVMCVCVWLSIHLSSGRLGEETRWSPELRGQVQVFPAPSKPPALLRSGEMDRIRERREGMGRRGHEPGVID